MNFDGFSSILKEIKRKRRKQKENEKKKEKTKEKKRKKRKAKTERNMMRGGGGRRGEVASNFEVGTSQSGFKVHGSKFGDGSWKLGFDF